MRTDANAATALARLLTPGRRLFHRLEIQRPDGMWVDRTVFWRGLRWSEDPDTGTVAGTLRLRRDARLGASSLSPGTPTSLAPLVTASPANIVNGNYAPAIAPFRGVRYSVGVAAAGASAGTAIWAEVFRGVLDDPSWGGRASALEVPVRDPSALVADAVIRRAPDGSPRVYGSAAGTPIATVLQAILADHGFTGAAWAIRVLGDTEGWSVREFAPRPGDSVWTVLRNLALEPYGWDFRMWRHADGAYVPTLRRPGRTTATVDLTLTPAQIRDIPRLVLNWTDVRNRGEALYVDQATGQTLRVTAEDPVSFAAIGQWRDFGLAAVDGIDTAAEATAYLAAALADLSVPSVGQDAVLPFAWPLQIGDVLEFPGVALGGPVPALYDQPQRFGVVRLEHDTAPDRAPTTTVGLRGRPVGALARWAARMRPVPRDGRDGVPGEDGADGQTTYTWVAYANSPDGAVDFTTGAPGGRAYRGEAVNRATPVESTNPADYVWGVYRGPAAFGLATRGNVVVAGSQIICTGVAAPWAGGDAYSTEGWRGGAYCSGRAGADSLNSAMMLALNSDPLTNVSFDSLDFAWYWEPGSPGRVVIYESGAGISAHGPYDATTTLAIQYDGKRVRYMKDGVVVRDVAAAADNYLLYLDCAFSSPGRIVDVVFGPQGARGADGIDGADGADVEFEYGPSATGPWDSDYTPGVDFYARHRVGAGSWRVSRIVGEDGAPGEDGTYLDFRFRMAATAPDTPTGANPAGWSDAPPTGTDPVWVVTARKAADGTLLTPWSTPRRVTGEQGPPGPPGAPGGSAILESAGLGLDYTSDLAAIGWTFKGDAGAGAEVRVLVNTGAAGGFAGWQDLGVQSSPVQLVLGADVRLPSDTSAPILSNISATLVVRRSGAADILETVTMTADYRLAGLG